MSGVRMYKVPNRIARLALGNGGVTVRQAVQQANAALDELRPPCLEIIDEVMAEIERRFGAGAAGRKAEPLGDLYALGLKIIEVAIGLPNSGIDEGARALCDMVDRSLAKDVVAWEAIDVHLQTLMLLRARGQAFTPEQRNAVLIGLKKVTTKKVGAADEPEAT